MDSQLAVLTSRVDNLEKDIDTLKNEQKEMRQNLINSIQSLNENLTRQTTLMEKMEQRAEKQDARLDKIDEKLGKVNLDLQTIKSNKASDLSVVVGDFLKSNGKLIIVAIIVIIAGLLGLNASEILTVIQGG
jgi:DNA repair exonuclease SbcCD ATPase subunit